MRLRLSPIVLAVVVLGCGPSVWIVRSTPYGGVIGVRGSGTDANELLHRTAHDLCGQSRQPRFISQQMQSQQVDCSYTVPQTDTSTANVAVGGTVQTATVTTTTTQTVQQTCADTWQEFTIECSEPQSTASYEPSPAPPAQTESVNAATVADPPVRSLGGRRQSFVTREGFVGIECIANRYCTAHATGTARVEEASLRHDGATFVRFLCL